MKSTRLKGVHYWSEYQADRRIDFNGFFIEREGANLMIDPMSLDDDQVDFVREHGGVQWVLLTNADHLRAAIEMRIEFDAKLAVPASERVALGEAGHAVNLWFTSQADLPAELQRSIDVGWIDGGKSEREAVFELTEVGALVFGDVVRCHESGKLRLLPHPKLADRERVLATLRPFAERDVEAILLGDGDCLFRDATSALAELLESLETA